MMQIAKKMILEVENKERMVVELNDLCTKLVKMEIAEETARVEIFNKLEAESEGKRVTDKTKTATADAELKDQIIAIKILKNDIAILRRNIELCDDKISVYKYMVRELEL